MRQAIKYISATYLPVLGPMLAVLPCFLLVVKSKTTKIIQSVYWSEFLKVWVTKSLLIENLSYLLIESPWRRLNSAPVCFGAKNNTFGRFQVEFSGSINALKLVHLNGKVSCGKSWAKSSCTPGAEKLRVFITDGSNTIILPNYWTIDNWYKIPGYNSSSSEIISTDFPNPLYLSCGQDLRLWFGRDLFDQIEDNNNGTVCTNVFVRYL